MSTDDPVRKLIVAWHAVMRGQYGDLIRADLEYYAQRQSHVPGDPTESAFRDGQRMMAQNILMMADDEQGVGNV